MKIAENIVLAIALLWALWQFLSLRYNIVNGDGIFPAFIPSFLLYVIFIVIVLAFHLSSFHLIWLGILAFFLGIPLIMVPPIQGLSIAFMGLLAMSSQTDEQEEKNIELSLDNKKLIKTNKPSKKGKGFSS